MMCSPIPWRRGRFVSFTVLWMIGVATVCAASGSVPRCDPAPKDVAWEHTLQDAYREHRYDDFITLLRQRQRTGDPEIMSVMGMYLGIGVGEFPSPVERNHTALRLTKRSALCGFPNAVYDLSVIYRRGDLGVAPDPYRADCLEALWRDRDGVSASACGITLNERNEIVNPWWDPKIELDPARQR